MCGVSKKHVTPHAKNTSLFTMTVAQLAQNGKEKVRQAQIGQKEQAKRNSVLLDVAKTEASKGYAPATITDAIRAIGRQGEDNRLQAAGGTYLTRADVKNAGAGWRVANPDSRLARPNAEWPAEIIEASEFLERTGWLIKQIQASRRDGDTSFGLVFAYPARINILIRRGHLILLDATHNTNKLKWLLYTAMVRDEQGSWIPVAHLLASGEDSAILASALVQIKQWCQGSWLLRYILTDYPKLAESAD